MNAMTEKTLYGMLVTYSDDSSGATHRIRKCRLPAEEEVFTVDLIKSKKLPEDKGDFVPGRIFDESGALIWKFQDEKFPGLCRIIPYADEYFLCFIGSKGLEYIIPVNRLKKIRHIRTPYGKSITGAGSLSSLLKAKIGIAGELGISYRASNTEKQLSEIWRKKAEQRRVEEEVEIQRKKEEARKAREKRVREILGRPRIVGWTNAGQRRHGVPVTEDEWRSLPKGTFVILVTSYNEGGAEGIREAFLIHKSRGGRCEKKNLTEVSAAEPVAQSQRNDADIEASDELLFEIDGEVVAVPHFPNNGVKTLRENGFDPDILVAIGKLDEKGRLALTKVSGETIGLRMPL